MKNNIFIEKTKSALAKNSKNYSEDRIAPRGFDIEESDTSKEECILIIGLNPSGDEGDSLRELENRTYFYSVDKIKTKWLYNKYYGYIYNFAADTLGSVKWPWCNKKWSLLEMEIEQYDDLIKSKKVFEAYYHAHKDNKYTIYIGDMFYYHEKNSDRIPLKDNTFDYQMYCRDMLQLHIDMLRKHNKTIKYIYINNAQVSHWLAGEENITYQTIEGVPIFLGSMLSSGRMDSFSRLRLINEIKENI